MATHVHRYPGLDLPSPFRAAAPLLVLALAVAAFALAPEIPWLVGALGAASFGAAAAIRAVRAQVELAAVRRTADRLIVHEPRGTDAMELVRWRSEELTSLAARDALRHEVKRTLAELDPRKLPSASPLHRPAARANQELLQRIHDRLGESRPVCARGVLLTRSLLRDGDSPLYAEGAESQLPHALARALGALEP